MKIVTVNLMMPIWVAAALYAGFSGKVPWWTIALMVLMEVKLNYTFNSR